MPDRKGLANRARRATRERQLIEAATVCISRRGLEATTVQAVAAAAGMAVGSINQYFRTKDRLLTAVLVHLSEEFEQAWRRAIARCGPLPAARLGAFIDCYFRAGICRRDKIAVWFAFWGEVAARPQYRRACAGYDRRHDQALERLCADLIEDGGYGALRAAPTARLIAAVCQGLWLEMLTGTDPAPRTSCRELAADVLRALFPRHARFFGARGRRPAVSRS